MSQYTPHQETNIAVIDLPSAMASVEQTSVIMNEPNHQGPPAVVEPQDNEENLSLNYAKLPNTTKLEEEPNPFEQSFSSVSADERTPNLTKPKLPPAASIDSPSTITDPASLAAPWDSLHTGALSPSMLQGPADTSQVDFQAPMYHVQAPDNVSPVRKTEFIPYQQEHYSPSKSANRARSKGSLTNSVRSSSGDTEDSSHDDDHAKHNKKRKMQSSKSIDDEEKRKNFLERNRQAALKCRQRKKQWLLNLQSKVEYLTNDNEQLQLQANAMREELMGLRSLLYAHKDCQHVNKQAVFDAIHRPVAGMPPMAPNPINMYPQPLLPTHPTAPGSTMAIPQQLGRAPLQRLS